MLDARMGEVFGAVYRFTNDARSKIIGDRVCVVEELITRFDDEIVCLGDGAQRYRARIEAAAQAAEILIGPCAAPRASAVALEGHALLERGVNADPARAAPVYLRKAQAEVSRAQSPEGRRP